MHNFFFFFATANAVLLLFYGCYRISKPFDYQFKSNRFLLLLIPVIAVLLPFVKGVFELPAQIEPLQIFDGANDGPAGLIALNQPGLSVLGSFYFSGVVLALLRFLFVLHISKRRVRGASFLSEGVYLLRNKEIDLHAFSFWGKIYLSKNWTGAAKDMALAHEKAHVKLFHQTDLIFYGFFKVFFWCNPVIYFLFNALKKNHEFEADQSVLGAGFSAHSYAEVMLKTAIRQSNSHFTHHFSQESLIKTRINMIFNNSISNRRALRALFFLPVFAIALVFCSSNSAFSQAYQANEVDKKAEFKGGQSAMIAHIVDGLEYPESEKKAGKEGKVFVSFEVCPTGAVEHAKILRGVSPALDNAALEIVQSMPNWTPAQKEGKAVGMTLTLPIQFKLD